jgi:hypothetical protein
MFQIRPQALPCFWIIPATFGAASPYPVGSRWLGRVRRWFRYALVVAMIQIANQFAGCNGEGGSDNDYVQACSARFSDLAYDNWTEDGSGSGTIRRRDRSWWRRSHRWKGRGTWKWRRCEPGLPGFVAIVEQVEESAQPPACSCGIRTVAIVVRETHRVVTYAEGRHLLSTVKKVRYGEAYPGVDLIYYGNQKQLEFDFLVAPNASAKLIKLRFDGIVALKIDESGSLILSAKNGNLAFHAPVAYQQIAGVRKNVKAAFKINGGSTVGFSIGNYDHSRQLIIDPVLVYSTYLGGSFFDAINALTVDPAGNAYVTGNADSCNFPTTPGAYNTAPNAGCLFATPGDYVFVTKLNPAGTALIYSTYLGPGTGTAIRVDAVGNAYVAGSAYSGFPTTSGAFQTVNNAAANQGINGFVTEINPDGTSLVYSTYLGGSYGGDQVNGIVVDGSGNAYLAGTANSTDFPTTPGAFQTTDNSPGVPISFVSKLNATGTGLDYSTYLHGTGLFAGDSIPETLANGIAVDALGNAYAVGITTDEGFPVTPGAFQTSYSTSSTNPGLFRSTGYVTKLNATGTQLLYSSYLGGDYLGGAQAIAIDSARNAYVTGWTTGGFVVTPKAFQSQAIGLDAFVAKISPDGASLVYSSYLGGSCEESGGLMGDTGFAIAIDTLGDAYVAGQACSQDFPLTTEAVQTVKTALFFDAFLSEINPNGTSLLYSTYLGGSGNLNTLGDWINGIGLDANGEVYVAGLTHSSDYPTVPGSFQLTNNASDGGAGFVAKFSIPKDATPIVQNFAISVNPAALTIIAGQSGTTTITITPQSGFDEQISFSCSGIPAGVACEFSSPLILPGANPNTSTLTIQTSGPATARRSSSVPFVPITSFAVALCCFGFSSRRRLGALLLVVIVGVTVSGCGGGSNGGGSNGGGSGGNGGSPSQQFAVTIIATAPSVQNTAVVTVSVD